MNVVPSTQSNEIDIASEIVESEATKESIELSTKENISNRSCLEMSKTSQTDKINLKEKEINEENELQTASRVTNEYYFFDMLFNLFNLETKFIFLGNQSMESQ